MRIVILCAAFICAAGFGHAIAGWPAGPGTVLCDSVDECEARILAGGVKLEPKEVQRAVEHAHSVSEWWPTIAQATVFTVIGVLIAVGQILQTKDPVTWKEAVGRCIKT